VSDRGIFALLGEFDDPDALIEAARHLHEKGYRHIDAFTPFPVEGLGKALGFEERTLPYIALGGGIAGGIGGYLLQYLLNAVDYPLNVGGRPLNAIPAFAIGTFELTVLGAALAAVFGMLWLNGLPRLHHPIFDSQVAKRITVDGFFLAVESRDRQFEPDAVGRTLRELGARSVVEVPA
jgi:hypothetical protein